MKQYKYIPEEMKRKKQWVVWGKLGVHYKILKMPFNPITEKPAYITNPKTWCSFDECEKAVKEARYCGLGYVFNNDYIAVDLDNVVLENKKILPEAEKIVNELNSYTEYSISKTGLHIIMSIGNFKLDHNRSMIYNKPIKRKDIRNKSNSINRKASIEIYTSKRFFIFTGDIFEKRISLSSNPVAIDHIYQSYIKNKLDNVAYNKAINPIEKVICDENIILKRMFESKNKRKIKELWEGSLASYNSHSEADLALCAFLAFYTQKNKTIIDSMFRKSALYREKWDKKRGDKTYGEITIEKAISSMNIY